MKKFIVLFSILLSSLMVYADQITCQVYGSSNNNLATVNNPVVRSDSKGYVGVDISLTKKATEETSVVVNIYEGKIVVGSGVCTIDKGNSTGHVIIRTYEANKTYQARLAEATCQLY